MADNQPTKYIDEFFTKYLYSDRVQVWRRLGGKPGGKLILYCESPNAGIAAEIAKALNLYHAAQFEIARKRQGK